MPPHQGQCQRGHLSLIPSKVTWDVQGGCNPNESQVRPASAFYYGVRRPMKQS